MLVGFQFFVEWNGFGFVCGLFFGIGIDVYGQLGCFFVGFLCRCFCMLLEVFVNYGCLYVEVEFVFFDFWNDVEDFMVVLVESDCLGGIVLLGVVGDYQFFVDYYVRYD